MPLHPPPHSNWLAIAAPALDARQTYWLNRPGALTVGLRKLGQLTLRVSREFKDSLPESEAWMLQHPARSPIWVREIVMAIDGIDCVFARSFTSLPASHGLWQGMRQLQTRPLADMLYHDPQIVRSPFYTCRLTSQQPLYRCGLRALGTDCPAAQELLARCSVFWHQDEPLLVAECFLPHFWRIASADEPA